MGGSWAFANSEGKSMAVFLKNNIFSWFGTPHMIKSEKILHFCNKVFHATLAKYGVKQYKVATPYHP